MPPEVSVQRQSIDVDYLPNMPAGIWHLQVAPMLRLQKSSLHPPLMLNISWHQNTTTTIRPYSYSPTALGRVDCFARMRGSCGELYRENTRTLWQVMADLVKIEINFKNWKVLELKKIPAGSRDICLQQKEGRITRINGKSTRTRSWIDGRRRVY